LLLVLVSPSLVLPSGSDDPGCADGQNAWAGKLSAIAHSASSQPPQAHAASAVSKQSPRATTWQLGPAPSATGTPSSQAAPSAVSGCSLSPSESEEAPQAVMAMQLESRTNNPVSLFLVFDMMLTMIWGWRKNGRAAADSRLREPSGSDGEMGAGLRRVRRWRA
jgi:hypothetical protein